VKSEEARLERDLESTYACENNIRMWVLFIVQKK
jgi:hypothetical protein